MAIEPNPSRQSAVRLARLMPNPYLSIFEPPGDVAPAAMHAGPSFAAETPPIVDERVLFDGSGGILVSFRSNRGLYFHLPCPCGL